MYVIDCTPWLQGMYSSKTLSIIFMGVASFVDREREGVS